MSLLGRLRQRFYQIHTTEVRTAEIQSQVSGLQAGQEALNARVGHGIGVAENTQNLAGEALTALNTQAINDHKTLDLTRLVLGRMEARQLALSGCTDWRTNEFRVYSQFGEDGLLQLLARELALPPALQTFVEFGVEDYKEASTRFLLLHNRWRGLVMDGSDANIAALQGEYAFRDYDLSAVSAFITAENIDDLLQANGFAGEIGLLSIDIDGNDFWVWNAITVANPVIVMSEYNYRFGPEKAAVVPYDPAFVKTEAHPSGIYYGASLEALCRLANRKGYAFVGCSSGGVNAFFVRRDRLPASLPERTAKDGYVAGTHAEMRDETGAIVKAKLGTQREIVLSLPLVTIAPDGTPVL